MQKLRFQSIKDSNPTTVGAVLELMDGDVKLTCVFDKTKPVHTASLTSKGRYSYGISMTVRPDQAQANFKTPDGLQAFMLHWLRWYAQENLVCDFEHADYWSEMLAQLRQADDAE